MITLLLACGKPPPTPEAAEPARGADDPKLAQFEDLTSLVGAWPYPHGDAACEGEPGFEFVTSGSSTTGYGLVDHRVEPPVAYDITGDRIGNDNVLRMAVRAGPTGSVAHLEMRFSAAGDVATVTWTQPAADPYDLVTPSGATSRALVPCP